jgi:thiol-disulfide isomerase/thioredoxin
MPRRRGALVPAMTAGLVACLAALACAVAFGAVWRARNGRMRGVAGGRRPAGGPGQPGQPVGDSGEIRPSGAVVLTGERLGQPLGDLATLVQFSSAFCAPCRATRRILADVAAMIDGVAHIEIDAESRLDLVRELNVLRTPTVLVLDSGGGIARRASGQPRKPDVIAALGAAIGVSIPTYQVGKEDSDSGSRRT